MNRALRSMMLQTDDEIESAMHDAGSALARKHGFTLVRAHGGYRLSMPGRVLLVGQIEFVNNVMRKAIKSPVAASSGAAGTVNLGLPENALQAVWLALPIVISNWTDNSENARHAGCIDDGVLSNEF